MAAHPLRPAAAARCRLAFDCLEHPGQRTRVVPGASHDLRAEQVGLLLEVAAVSQKYRAQPELAALRDGRPRRAADHRAAHGTGELTELQPGILCFRSVGGAVT